MMEAAFLEELLNFIGSSCLRSMSLEFILPQDFAHLDISMYLPNSIRNCEVRLNASIHISRPGTLS